MQTLIKQQRCSGRKFYAEEVSQIREVVGTCGGINRRELAYTVCELLEWKRPNGGLKPGECKDLLELLENKGILKLPEKRHQRSNRTGKIVAAVAYRQPYSTLTGSVEAFTPLEVRRVQTREQRRLFEDLVSQYQYPGYAMAYGARLQYLIYTNRTGQDVVGCVQFSSPAWRMKARDQWIGRDDIRRRAALQQVVNNSRFPVLAHIRNLANKMLSCILRRLGPDRERQYGVAPLLVETLVARQRFHGGRRRAANWIKPGETSGRGRMDRTHQRHGARVKTVLIYTLVKNAARRHGDGR